MSLELQDSPDVLKDKFYSLKTPRDVASLLDVKYQHLIYHIYTSPLEKRYTSFGVPKKSGGERIICAPISSIKIIQQKLNSVLRAVYAPKLTVHGFVVGRGITTNANVHLNKKYILNIDLKDFFPSINFGRVRGMFMSPPYNLNASVATILAQICCFDNQLPQGGPTSPIISNMICSKMDSELKGLAKKYRCNYTRYADDITFSTSLPNFPHDLARTIPSGQVEIGGELQRIIGINGFEINSNKIRLTNKYHHQEVTGITVNNSRPNVKRTYIRQIRAMLYAWEKFGLEAAQEEFINIYDKKHRRIKDKPIPFKSVVKGKIDYLGMVIGKSNPIYLRFLRKLKKLAPGLVNLPVQTPKNINVKPRIMTEGKTDWKHLKAAFTDLRKSGKIEELELDFYEDESSNGDSRLLDFCEQACKVPHELPIICVFDRDVPKTVDKVTVKDCEYKSWGNNIFSLAIPVPPLRQETPLISIEFYYRDEDLKREDRFGRRLFLSNEFDPVSGKHFEDATINCIEFNKIRNKAVQWESPGYPPYVGVKLTTKLIGN